MNSQPYDLVKMLREAADHSIWPEFKEKTLFWIAAEEIERLRFLVDQLKKQFHENGKEN